MALARRDRLLILGATVFLIIRPTQQDSAPAAAYNCRISQTKKCGTRD